MMTFGTSKERQRPRLWRTLVSTTLLWAVATTAKPSIPMDYCASINTASMSANSSIYQSDGLCHDFCNQKSAALAIVKEQSCWCSDYVPSKSSQVSIDKCSDGCPGFPDDVCGGDGLFGYMSLDKKPAGTSGSTTAPPTASVVETETVRNTVQKTVTHTPTFSKPSVPSSSTSIPTSSTSTSTSPGTTAGPTVSTVSSGGTVRTVTVVPTLGSNPGSSANTEGSSSKKGLSTGAAVGISVAVVVAVLVAAGVLLFVLWKRRKERQANERAGYDAPSQRGSSAGMMGTPKMAEASENRYVGGSDGRTMAESWENSAQSRRRSAFMPVDPRMDASHNGIYSRENKSHESINTLRDDQDYSRRVHDPPRVLRATNPDPD